MKKAISIDENTFNKIKEFRDYLLIEKKMRFKNYSEFFEWLIEKTKEVINGKKEQSNNTL
ncbi:MAG: hypothetical protein NC926_10320 [Candidatus Omnitrophica bacterium]|nr:hypothetical protein [Candidatus Omnitrophota bacterium]